MCVTMSKCCGRYGLGKSLVTLTRSGWRASTVLKLMSVSTSFLPSFFSVCFRTLSIAFSLINFVELSLEIIVCVVYYAHLFFLLGKGFLSGVDGVSSLRRMMRWFSNYLELQIIRYLSLVEILVCALQNSTLVLTVRKAFWCWWFLASSHNVELILHNLELQFIRFVSFVILPFCLRCLFSRSALRLPWWILWCWIWRSCLCYLLFLFICQRALDFEVGVLSSPCGMLRWFKLTWTAIC